MTIEEKQALKHYLQELETQILYTEMKRTNYKYRNMKSTKKTGPSVAVATAKPENWSKEVEELVKNNNPELYAKMEAYIRGLKKELTDLWLENESLKGERDRWKKMATEFGEALDKRKSEHGK